MDTLMDSILGANGQTWWKDSNWWVALTSIASVIIALVVAWYIRQQNKRESRREIHTGWGEKFGDRERFWQEIKGAYNLWLQEIRWKELGPTNRPPETLVDLVRQAKKPPTLHKTFRFQKDSWEKLSAQCSEGPQIWLRDFCERVYPPNSAEKSIILSSSAYGIEGYDGFHAARASLAIELDHSAEIDLKYLYDCFGEDQYPLIIFLCWLEFALAESLHTVGPGYRALFRLAMKIDRSFGGSLFSSSS